MVRYGLCGLEQTGRSGGHAGVLDLTSLCGLEQPDTRLVWGGTPRHKESR